MISLSGDKQADVIDAVYLVDTLLIVGKIFKPWWLIIPFDVLIFRCRRFRLNCDKITI